MWVTLQWQRISAAAPVAKGGDLGIVMDNEGGETLQRADGKTSNGLCDQLSDY